VLVNAQTPVDSLVLDELRGFLNDEMNERFEHFYAPDPNQGLWDSFRSGLGMPASDEASPRVTFLKNQAEVVQAVAADPRALGIASTLDLPDSLAEWGVRLAKIKKDAVSPAVDPTYENVGYGEYPLFHYLYVACLANGSVRAAMFVTQLTSDRGQRQIERAGVLPARQTARPIVLTRQPVGGSH
jgi:ABC-type phosphate transport system substrate-binding protein